jgi:Tfp pilus assembly protein PilO
MRLSKKVWIIVGIGVFAIALGFLLSTYLEQVEEKQQLSDRLAVAETRLPVLVAEREDLEDELTQAESSLDKSLAEFPESIESIEYGEYIFEVADTCNVELASLSFPKPATKEVGPVTYSVVSLSLPVKGAVADIFEFIQVLRTDPRFASTAVKSVTLNVGEGSATISVDICGYKG